MSVLRRIGSRIVGAIAGAVTGLFAGFIPGRYYLLTVGSSLWANGNYGAPFVSLVMLGVYIASLPFFMLFQMGRGFIAGAVGGLLAALTYPKTLNEEFKTDRKNRALLTSIHDASSGNLLSQEEINEVRALVAQKGAVTAFDKRVDAYKELLRSKLFNLTGPVPENPVGIIARDAAGKLEIYIVDKFKLLKLAEDRTKKSLPMLITVAGVQVEIVNVRTISAEFITYVRDSLSALHAAVTSNARLHQKLGVTSGNAGGSVVPQEAAPKTNAERIARLETQLAQAKAQAEEAQPLLEGREDLEPATARLV